MKGRNGDMIHHFTQTSCFHSLVSCLRVLFVSSWLHFRAVGDKGQSEFEESLRKLFKALVKLMADVKNETLLTQVK